MRRARVVALLFSAAAATAAAAAAACGSVADSTADGSVDGGPGTVDAPATGDGAAPPIDAPTYTIDQSNQSPLGSAGNATSGLPFTLVCPMGTVLVGFEGHADTAPCDLALVCADPDATSLLGDVRTGAAGGSGCADSTRFADRCAVGEAVVGFHGGTTAPPAVSLGSLGITCASLLDWTTAAGTGVTRTLAAHGTLGTTPFELTCMPGMVIWGISGRSGSSSVDQIAGSCVAVSLD